MTITVYAPKKGVCGYSDKARKLLKHKKMKYTEHIILPEKLQVVAGALKKNKYVKKDVRVTMPIIFINGVHLPHGSSDLERICN